jgi:hypothetical protein
MMPSLRNAVAAAALLIVAASCGGNYDKPTILLCPSEPEVTNDDLRAVSGVFEKRCGTLDCHGDIARPLKIYGQNGLRHFTDVELADPNVAVDAGTIPGGSAGTTDEELALNQRSICGVEPERTAAVLNGNLAPEDLLILRKPLTVEDHKGAQLFIAKSDPGAVCIISWLNRAVDRTSCTEAVQAP